MSDRPKKSCILILYDENKTVMSFNREINLLNSRHQTCFDHACVCVCFFFRYHHHQEDTLFHYDKALKIENFIRHLLF